MKLTARIPVSVALLVLLGTATGCDKLKARDQLNKGVAAFKNARYDEAVGNFQNAIKLDPDYENAKLYLATAYAYQVVPGLKEPANLALAQKAIAGFSEVLAKDPNDLTALRQIASINRNIDNFDAAKEYENKVIALDPTDAEAYYTIGSIDWNLEHYKNTVPILAADGVTDDGKGNVKMSKAACAKLQAANTGLVDEALKVLNKSVELDPTYDNAMTYLHLAYLSKANLECGNDAARKDDLAQADIWAQKTMDTRKANELKKEQKLGGGVTMN
jgi:tetratricopeptide (TPR) repeat protein